MKKLLLSLSFLFTGVFVYSQITFEKTYGGSSEDNAYCVRQTSDRGYIISGSTSSFGIGLLDAYLVRTDSIGDILWTRTFGKPTEFILGNIVEQTNDGGFVIACEARLNGWDGFLLIKTNSDGDTLWTRNFGADNGADLKILNSIEQTNDGGYIIGASGDDVGNLIRTDSYGDTIWTKRIGFSVGESINPCLVRNTKDGGYVVAGNDYTFSTNNDFALAKTDSSGNVLWSKVYGSSNDDFLVDVHQTSDGGYIMAGSNGFGAGGYDAYLIKTDSIGVVTWSRTYGSTFADYGGSVQQTNDGGYVICGANENNAWVIKIDNNGLVLWSNHFKEGPNFCQPYVEQTSDSGFIISGVVRNWLTGYDIYLIKTDANGNSGCNQSSNLITEDTALTFSSAKSFNVSSGCLIGNTMVQISSGGTITQSCIAIGVDETIHNNLIEVLPNPTSGKVNLQIPQQFGQTKTLEVFNCTGQLQLVQTSRFDEVDISILTSGIYFLVLTNAISERQTIKIIKE